MKIEVWKCEDTGAIFEFEKDYRSHRRQVLKQRREHERRVARRKEFDDWLAAEKENITHLNQIAPWILLHQKSLMNWVNEFGAYTFMSDKFHIETDNITDISITETRYEEKLSNSHSCPKNGVTNWCNQNKNLPSGYPGYGIRVSGNTQREWKHRGNYPTSNIFKLIGIHTECGGGGNENWSWQGKIFIADWPGLSREILAEKLKGKM